MGNNFSTSDFITDDLPQTEQRKFSHVQKVYLSSSGYNCIFQGERYGKLHILKTLQPDYATLAFYQKALQKEFNIGYQLEHPHICRTLGWENVEGIGQCIILEYVDGLTLKDLMDEGKLTKELADKLGKDYESNPEGLQELVASMPKQTTITENLGDIPEKFKGKTFQDLYVSGVWEEVKTKYPDYAATLKK